MGQWVNTTSGFSSSINCRKALYCDGETSVWPSSCRANSGRASEQGARFFQFRRSNGSGLGMALAGNASLAAGQLQGHDLVARVDVASDGPAAAGLRIARMCSRHQHLQFCADSGHSVLLAQRRSTPLRHVQRLLVRSRPADSNRRAIVGGCRVPCCVFLLTANREPTCRRSLLRHVCQSAVAIDGPSMCCGSADGIPVRFRTKRPIGSNCGFEMPARFRAGC